MLGKGSHWTPLCCKLPVGACASCRGATLAYVSKYYNNSSVDDLVNSTFIRMCPSLLEEEDDTQIGLALFHELIHMVSGVGDVDGTYEKLSSVVLAENAPETARLNANNYMLYAAQNGLSLNDYDKFTDAWGTHVHSTTCSD
jgi:hypothetical protein